MKYNWIYNRKNEIGRILFTASSIARGLYGKQFFYVLPKLTSKYKEAITYFPQTFLCSDRAFWEYVARKNYQVPVYEIDREISELVENALSEFDPIEDSQIEARKSKWERVSGEFGSFLDYVFKDIGLNIRKVNIYPTFSGSRESYWYSGDTKLDQVNLYYRIDADLWVVAHGIMAMIVHFLHFKNKYQKNENTFSDSGEWMSKERIVDFFIQRTSLSKIFPSYKPIQDLSLTEGSAELAKESARYLAELGFSTRNPLVVGIKGIYNTEKREYLKDLSMQEAKVLSLLVKNERTAVTYDQISDVLWGKESVEKFSLYYLNKLIHQIRLKLKLNGLNAEMIKTKRGVGYMYLT
ncbi:MAG: helix-turn-helix domain-containing protein [Candidatus Dojkabacteria bacterium]|nr:helix-turn-helix domain-containing protein [Candidatus Dojkabacteria bacterium]